MQQVTVDAARWQQDCRDVGIETMTPRELDALVSRWGEVST